MNNYNSKNNSNNRVFCSGCESRNKSGSNRKNGTKTTPAGSKITINTKNCFTTYPYYEKPKKRKDYIVENIATIYNLQKNDAITSQQSRNPGKCSCQGMTIADLPSHRIPAARTPIPQSMGVNTIKAYHSEIRNPSLKKYTVLNCLTIPDDKECKCSPPKPSPPCKTFDCDCIAEIGNIAARKHHRSYCPLFKHKSNCPVMISKEHDDKMKLEEEEEEAEPLPYGLPPIKLGPCPVMGKPCTYPDGFARMYKTATQAPLPASNSDDGRVCCSKEYERIKKALTDYMRFEKDHDYRCINKFDVDTERRCCDREQRLIALTGKDCCGTHKLAIQEKYRRDIP